jgi:hypothetical protein
MLPAAVTVTRCFYLRPYLLLLLLLLLVLLLLTAAAAAANYWHVAGWLAGWVVGSGACICIIVYTGAVLSVGGWYDAEDPLGPFAVYYGSTANNPTNDQVQINCIDPFS